MKLLLALSLLLSIGAQAQQSADICGPNRDQVRVPGGSKPSLTCGKYEHDVRPGGCTLSGTPAKDGSVMCLPSPPVCVDDMHQVTEKEWQAIKERLGLAESQLIALGTDFYRRPDMRRIPATALDITKPIKAPCPSKNYSHEGDRNGPFRIGDAYRLIDVIYCYAEPH